MKASKISSLAEFSSVKYTKVSVPNTNGLVRLLCFEPGQSVALHRHPEGHEVFYILTGTAEFTVEGETNRVEAEAFVTAKAGTFHRWKNGSERLILISILIPPSSYRLAEKATRMEIYSRFHKT